MANPLRSGAWPLKLQTTYNLNSFLDTSGIRTAERSFNLIVDLSRLTFPGGDLAAAFDSALQTKSDPISRGNLAFYVSPKHRAKRVSGLRFPSKARPAASDDQGADAEDGQGEARGLGDAGEKPGVGSAHGRIERIP